jgi:proline iminopeptidase
LVSNYFNYISAGGVKMIPIQTPIGDLKFDKRFGTNPKIKILLLHGGPAMTTRIHECFETFFKEKEFYEYDQLDPTTVINQKIAFYYNDL